MATRFDSTEESNNKIISGEADAKFLGEDKEWLVLYAKRKLEEQHYDHFIFGHRHLPMEIKLNEKSTVSKPLDQISNVRSRSQPICGI